MRHAGKAQTVGNLTDIQICLQHQAGNLFELLLRNVGVPVAHSLIGFASLQKGLGKVILNEAKLASDLEDNWAVVAEAMQTILRREGYPNPYEALKALTRTGGHITAETIRTFIDSLDVDDDVKAEMRAITPHNYTGMVR